jgi:hypothetical protein
MEKTKKVLKFTTDRILYFLKENNIKLDCYSYGQNSGLATKHCDIAIDCWLPTDKIDLITPENLKIEGVESIEIEFNPYNRG